MAHLKRQFWMQTYTGRKVDPYAFHPEDYSIDDIAESLARQVRFTGHMGGYTIAQHCVYMSLFFGLAGLAHDMTEGYFADVSRPTKSWISKTSKSLKIINLLKEYEERIWEQLSAHYGVGQELSDELHKIDVLISLEEGRQLSRHSTDDWENPYYPETFNTWLSARTALPDFLWKRVRKWRTSHGEHPILKIRVWGYRKAKRMFLRRFYELTGRKLSFWDKVSIWLNRSIEQ